MFIKRQVVSVTGLLVSLLLCFQNCSQPGSISKKGDNLAVCQGVSCTLDPLTTKPAVTTVLIALGDEADDQLVVNGGSAQLVAETIIRYSSPKSSPKILLVRDLQFDGEDPEDTIYVRDVLLKRYDVTYMDEPQGGLKSQDLEGYDVVWFNNPGHPMGSVKTRDTLIAFPGAVVLQGDDLTRGTNFDLSPLTGLHYIDNGTDVRCGDQVYHHDNNTGYQFRVSLNPDLFPQVDSQTIEFRYGNDIDNSSVVLNKLEVMATAKGGPEVCTEDRPTIVRYLKD